MARRAAVEDSEVFRAVITTAWPATGSRPERTSTEVCGPYRTRGAARAQVTGRLRYARRYWQEVTVTGRVERASLNWESVS